MKTASIQIAIKWERFIMKKDFDAINKKNKLGWYYWSSCGLCNRDPAYCLHFTDNFNLKCSLPDDFEGERYDKVRYWLTAEFNTRTWEYAIKLQSKPMAQGYRDFKLINRLSGKGYFEMLKAFDDMKKGDYDGPFGPDNMGVPYYMEGFRKLCDIIAGIDEKFKRAEGEFFPLEYICDSLEEKLNENEANWNNLVGMYGVYGEAYTEAVRKDGKIHNCYAECYVGYNPSTGAWKVERNRGKTTRTVKEGTDIDEFLKHVKTYVKHNVCIDEFVKKIKFFKDDLKKIQTGK